MKLIKKMSIYRNNSQHMYIIDRGRYYQPILGGIDMQYKVQINNTSIETAGVKKDFFAAVSEYIWNGFDANATTIEINSSSNSLGGLDTLEIIDDGDGIVYENLSKTFGAFLSSEKRTIAFNPNIHGNKGKGRYSFVSFADNALWETYYKSDDGYIKYKIEIDSNNKDYYNAFEKEKIIEEKTGTKVSFIISKTIVTEEIDSKLFKNSLLNIFAWYLYLNKNKNKQILINGIALSYDGFIDKHLSESVEIEIENTMFNVHFIKWIDKIQQNYYYYFLDKDNGEAYKKCTSFNNNAINFYHSVYIVSDYFNNFVPLNPDIDGQIDMHPANNDKDEIFKTLIKKLNALVEKKRNKFIKNDAKIHVQKFEQEGAFPKFADNKYDQERKKDLVNVVTEIYCIQPKIFYKTKPEQIKTIIGFLNLLLNTEERENIINIIENVTSLTPEERGELSNVLKKTGLAQITQTIKMIENRYKIIELLKKMVFDLDKFTTERYHIQKAIEENYWLFGEQYHLVSADKNFEKLLSEYLFIIDNEKDKEKYKIENQDRLRRPDIFMCRKRKVDYFNETQLEENIIVELKEPRVVLNKEVYRQIEDYMDLISTEPQFNSQLRKWKFIMVSREVDDYIKGLYKTNLDKGKMFLVRPGEQFEIYAMTWDDVFKSFDIRHSYIYEKLNFDKSAIEEEFKTKGIDYSRNGSDELIDKIHELKVVK